MMWRLEFDSVHRHHAMLEGLLYVGVLQNKNCALNIRKYSKDTITLYAKIF